MWHETLREVTMDLLLDSSRTHHIDFLSSGSDEDNELYFEYYADEAWRDRWRQDSPDDVIPPHVDPPYDRDSKLPLGPEPQNPSIRGRSWLTSPPPPGYPDAPAFG